MKQYTKVPINPPKRSVFDLSHEHKTTINMGELVPILCQEVVPGDNFKLSYEAIVKLQPILAPILHRINVYAQFFFVPNRLIWSDWEDFITKGQTGELEPNFPKFVGVNSTWRGLLTTNGLADYLGIPVLNYPDNAGAIQPISQLPFRAYQKIYNEWYRDQNLQSEAVCPNDSINLDPASSPGTIGELLTLRKRCWEKDYFTSALPTAQRGDAVLLPLGSTAPVEGTPQFEKTNGSGVTAGAANFNAIGNLRDANNDIVRLDLGQTGLVADLSEATAASVEDVRTAFAIQHWKEALMRFGARYREVIKGLFGVVTSDARLQIPEYLGGGRMPISIAEVLQTSQTDSTPQGTMAGHGLAAGNIIGFNKSFEEHGFVIGIMSIMPRTAYCQGLPKIFSKFDIFDYATPQFMHLGEEEVLTKEIYLSNLDEDDLVPFGYQPRYMDYRCNTDRVSGEFRDGLDYWHMGRIFPSKPSLNSDFVTCTPDERIFPVMTDPTGKFKKVLVMGLFKFTAIRPVSKYGQPL